MRRGTLLLCVFPAVALFSFGACGDDGSGGSATGVGGAQSSSGVGGNPEDPPTDAAATGVGGGADPNVTITKGPACSSAATCTLTFTGTAFDAYEGKTLRWGLLEAGSLAFESSGPIADGGFSFTEAIGKGSTYYLQYWIDDDDDMTCDAPPTDAVFRVDLSTIYQDLSVAVVFSEQSFNELGCLGF